MKSLFISVPQWYPASPYLACALLAGQLNAAGYSTDTLDLNILAFIDHNITVNVIKDGEIVEKRALELPRTIENVCKCLNPRCITSIEQGLKHIFYLADEKNEIYRCRYCDERYTEATA